MTILFFPQDDELETTDIDGKLEILLNAAERYKAAVLDSSAKTGTVAAPQGKRGAVPRDIPIAYNWDGLAEVLRTTREISESVPSSRLSKAMRLEKLAGVYEVLRGARMPKLEAVRLALMNEMTQLRGGK